MRLLNTAARQAQYEENESKQNRGRDSPTYKARLSAEDYPEQLFASFPSADKVLN